jgi:hypothetical protein
MQAILIDSAKREIRAVEYNGLAEMKAFVGGYIEVAFAWPNGDVLYVDEEGLLKPQSHFFRIPERPDQPLCGNGLLVGREVEHDDGPYHTEPPTLTVEALHATVEFRSRDQVAAWAKAHASEPAGAVYFAGPGGTVTEHVFAHTGEVYAAVLDQPTGLAKLYRGVVPAAMDWRVQVIVDGTTIDLPWRLDLANHSPDGLSWGYGGSGPWQTALAILADALGDDARAVALADAFKWQRIAKLDQDQGWVMPLADVLAWAAQQEAK